MAYILTYVPDDYCDRCFFKRSGEVVCQMFGDFLDSDENCEHYTRCEKCMELSKQVENLANDKEVEDENK